MWLDVPFDQVLRGSVWLGVAGRLWPLAAIWAPNWATSLRTTVSPPRWSSSSARAHAVVVSVLTPAEVLIAARRLAGARPHLAAVAGIVHHEDLWRLCRDELTGVESASMAGIFAAAGSASSSGPRRGPGSCDAARRSHGA